MRLSADYRSPFFNENLVQRARAFVDGLELQLCVEASEEEGWADIIVTDDAGRVAKSDGHTIQTRRLTGAVRILV